MASASSREKKYQRDARRRCPHCKQETIFPSKEPVGAWFCWRKHGGCGSNFPAGDRTIEDQIVGKTTNPDLYDSHNAILKIAQKRALVGTTLNCTAASDAFAQDLEDLPEGADPVRTPPTNSHPRPAPPPRPQSAPPPAGPPRVTLAQLKKYNALRERLGISELEGRERTGAFLKRPITSIADDLTPEEIDRVNAAMDKETEKGGAA